MNNTDRLYPELKGTDRVRVDCGKCGGRGVIDYGNVVLDGVVDGFRVSDRICFDCGGKCYRMVLVSSLRATARKHEKARADQLAREEAYLAAQAARAAAKAAEEAARRAAGTPVPEGRIVVTGTIKGFKESEGFYGWTLKMIVEDDRGFKVYGTVPSSLEVLPGDRVTFTATVERSHNDELFGFFKRPTKAGKV